MIRLLAAWITLSLPTSFVVGRWFGSRDLLIIGGQILAARPAATGTAHPTGRTTVACRTRDLDGAGLAAESTQLRAWR